MTRHAHIPEKRKPVSEKDMRQRTNPRQHARYQTGLLPVKPKTVILAAVLCIAGPAAAKTIDVFDNHGGSVAEYNARWSELAARGVSVRIVGPCQSACTVLLGHIQRSRICVTPAESFGFHLARLSSATAILWNGYQADIRAWANQHGGLQRDFIWLRAPETFRFFHKCG
jgi:hypothetical protein